VQAGEVLVSRVVSDLVAGARLRFSERGIYELKGLPGRWQLFAPPCNDAGPPSMVRLGSKVPKAATDQTYSITSSAVVSNIVGTVSYLFAQTLVEVLKQCGDDLTRENVMRQAANLDNLQLGMLLPGITVNTGPSDFAPVKQMQMQRFNGRTWEPFGSILNGALIGG
jgi:hypothetical protein